MVRARKRWLAGFYAVTHVPKKRAGEFQSHNEHLYEIISGVDPLQPLVNLGGSISDAEFDVNEIISYNCQVNEVTNLKGLTRHHISDLAQVALSLAKRAERNYEFAKATVGLQEFELGPGSKLPKLLSQNAVEPTWTPVAVQTIKAIHPELHGRNNRAVQPQDICPICCEQLLTTEGSQVIWILPCCEKPFHLACIFEWLKGEMCTDCDTLQKAKCPLCRKDWPMFFVVYVLDKQREETVKLFDNISGREGQHGVSGYQIPHETITEGSSCMVDSVEMRDQIERNGGLSIEEWTLYWISQGESEDEGLLTQDSNSDEHDGNVQAPNHQGTEY